jgi:predicted alpha/beta superfamily hydrolase
MLGFSAVFCQEARPQSAGTGALSGTISDPNGPSVVNAQAHATSEATGSSYGDEIALYTVMTQFGRYRWLYLESPSLYAHDDELLRRSEFFKDWPERIYVGAGTAEGAKGDGQQMDSYR